MLRRCVLLSLLALIPALGVVARSADGPPAVAAVPSTRDPLQWPFSPDSIWNMPIGSGAEYTPAQIQQATEYGMTVDPDIIIMEPQAPLTPVYYNPDGWTGGSRCTPGAYLYSIPMPANYVIPGAGPNDTPNYASAALMPDGRTIAQGQPLTRCTTGGPVTAYDHAPDVDLYGTGILGAHGGSGLSSIGGTVRLGELVPGGEIHHALKVNVNSTELWGGALPRYRWPAVRADNPNTYTGDVAALKMGALLALLPSVNINAMGLETEPARILAWTMQNYGAYVVDSTGWNVYALAVEHSPDGTVEAEFQSRWGFTMTPSSRNNAWSRDMDRIFGTLNVVDNNAPTAIGGGGTPRQPLAPPISPGGGLTDTDGDGLIDLDDNCVDVANANQTDGDGDRLGDACEAAYGTNASDADTDNDGCVDGVEVRTVTYSPTHGGDRDPLNPGDFFDVSGDVSVDLNDVISVLGYYGDPGTSTAGNARDREGADISKPWRVSYMNNGIDMTDAVFSLLSFGHDCSWVP